MTELREILPALKAWFAPADHEERKLPGGGKWFFVPWQRIRERLDEVCPEWSVHYSDPVDCLNVVVVRCRLTICGVTREGVGNSDIDLEKKGYGTPVERATADAFKNACESFGVCAYLDTQKDNREKFVGYMHKQGDGRAYKAAYDNGWTHHSEGAAEKEKPTKPLTLVPPSPKPQPAVNQKPQGMYPQHNATVKRVRELTGHEAQEVINQCKVVSQGKRDRPDQLSPTELEQLLESLVVGWCSGHFPSVDHARTAYRGKVETLTASGAGIEDAIASFIESVKAAPVK